MKRERHNASYATTFILSDEKIDSYKKEVIGFIQKTKDMVEND